MTDTNIEIIKQTKEKIIKLLAESGWSEKLRLFLNSNDMDVLLEKLLSLSNEGKHFTPTLKDVFKAFVKCPFDNVKVVIIGQDPYPYINVADGIAFSCSKTNKLQPSLRYIINAINRTVDDRNIENQDKPSVDLVRWADQGVLCINAALTCEIDKVGSHYEIWSDFIFTMLDALNFNKFGIPYVLMGKVAHSLENFISPNNAIIKTTHPASAAYAKLNEWDCNNCFNKVNDILISQDKTPIKW
jgi:uracil-DNA glycosylase